MYYKVEAIRIKVSLSRIYAELKSGKNLADGTINMYIPDDIVASENSRVIKI